MQSSRYNIFHAIAAFVVIVFAIKKDFWHTFLHGFSMGTPSPKMLLFILICQTALFGILALFLWISTLFPAARDRALGVEAPPQPVPDRLKAVKTALVAFIPICLLALGLEWTTTTILEKVFGITLAMQDLVKWLQPDTYALPVRLALIAFILFEAPLLEEPLFRGIIFRGCARSMPVWAAMAVSGFVFALVHVNAATFLALWFLGVAFAWLYRRTGSILAPMTAHFLFNTLNLAMCLIFPELAGGQAPA